MIGEDKFIVVLFVMAIIFIGLAVYLYSIDRKLSRIEKKITDLKNTDKQHIK